MLAAMTHSLTVLSLEKENLIDSLTFFDRCAIKTSLYLPQAALRFSARHATA